MFSLFRKACLLYKTWKSFFSRFILAIYDMGIEGVLRSYWGLQGITRGLQGVPGGYKGIQGVTGGYKG